jgi:hypothetical protein
VTLGLLHRGAIYEILSQEIFAYPPSLTTHEHWVFATLSRHTHASSAVGAKNRSPAKIFSIEAKSQKSFQKSKASQIHAQQTLGERLAATTLSYHHVVCIFQADCVWLD